VAMGRAVQFRLLLWKNYMLQRRKILVTCFEIGIPALFALILIFVRLRVAFNDVAAPTVWKEFEVNSSLFSGFSLFNWRLHSWRISYAPNTTAANTLMTTTMTRLNALCQSTCIKGLVMY